MNIDKESDELADLLTYSFLMAESVGVDIEKIMLKKLEKNKKRHPVDVVKGNSGKNIRIEIEE